MSLACMQVKHASVPGSGWNPSVVIQGKVFVGMGPLRPTDGVAPIFAQLYVLDPAHADAESELRMNNMCLPATTTAADVCTLRNIVQELQSALHDHNPYIQDIKSSVPGYNRLSRKKQLSRYGTFKFLNRYNFLLPPQTG